MGKIKNILIICGVLLIIAFVYSSYSLHHWEEPEKAIRNLWSSVAENGILYIYDFKRIGWLSALSFKGKGMQSNSKVFTPDEVRTVLREIGITEFSVKTSFPCIFQSIIAWK